MQKLLHKRVHISWIIGWASFGVVGGTALTIVVPYTFFASVAWLIMAASLFALAAIKRLGIFCMVALLAGGICGLWRGAIQQTALQAYDSYIGTNVYLTGRVNEDTSFGPQGDQRITLANVHIGAQTLPGKVWVSTMSTVVIKRGDYLVLRGQLEKGFGNTPASIYHAQIVHALRPYPGDIARRVRDWFADAVRHAIPSPESALGIGYLVGQRSTLPQTLDAQLKIVGLTHVVVASGYNLTILVRFARRLFARFSKYAATVAAALMIVSFLCITGFSPSMSRAGLVASFSLLAWYYGRAIHPLVLLSFAAGITTLINPAYAWGDIGWLLSFLSFAGVIILAPLIHEYFWGRLKKPGVVRQIVVDTMSAQAMTMPVMIFAFGQYSAYALPANMLVLPFIPLTMVLTFFAGVAGLVAPTFAHIVGVPAQLLLHYMTSVVARIAILPGASNTIVMPVFFLIGGYAFLALAIMLLKRATKHNFRSDSVVE